jgi:hypothetical protein
MGRAHPRAAPFSFAGVLDAVRRLSVVSTACFVLLVAPASAAPDAPVEAPAPAFLDRLRGEINARRALAGAPALVSAGPDADLAVTRYLADLAPVMRARHACFHGRHDPVAPGWDYVAASGFAARAGGEVLGCPADGFAWTPRRIADEWWASPPHFAALYADARAAAVACGAHGGGEEHGYQTVACITYRP